MPSTSIYVSPFQNFLIYNLQLCHLYSIEQQSSHMSISILSTTSVTVNDNFTYRLWQTCQSFIQTCSNFTATSVSVNFNPAVANSVTSLASCCRQLSCTCLVFGCSTNCTVSALHCKESGEHFAYRLWL